MGNTLTKIVTEEDLTGKARLRGLAEYAELCW